MSENEKFWDKKKELILGMKYPVQYNYFTVDVHSNTQGILFRIKDGDSEGAGIIVPEGLIFSVGEDNSSPKESFQLFKIREWKIADDVDGIQQYFIEKTSIPDWLVNKL